MSDEKTQSPQENPFEASPNELGIAPKAQEGAVSPEPKQEPKSKIDEAAFLAELEEAEQSDPGDAEGGAFWVIRKIFLEILKVVIVLGIIGFVIWLIWGGLQGASKQGIESGEIKTEKEVSQNKPVTGETKKSNPIEKLPEKIKQKLPGQKKHEPETTPPVNTQSPEQVPVSLQDLFVIVGDAEFLAFQEYRAGQDLAEQTMGWLRTTKQFSEVGVTEVVQYADPGERSEKIEQKIQEGDRLLAEAQLLRSALGQEVAFWTQRNNQDTALTQKVNDEYKAILQNIEVTKLNAKVAELTEARRKIAESQTYLSAYSSLLKNVENFERLLKSKVIPVYRPAAPQQATQ